MVNQIRVHRIIRTDQYHQRALPAASGPAGLLAETRDRAGETSGHHRVQPADIDAELQRVRRGHAQQFPLVEGLFQVAAVLGGVASPVGGDAHGIGGTTHGR